ncbi:hypothetical protein [Coleofasciculus sp. FACHB-SPT9]|uniref:hypothetical protein n=1 Tax=Cyanophyceae TaxID=3028117 RepID=UPI0019AD6C66|nr:hypothetical protein [Coleofasciculus sp. FACHB-SPT9]
MADLSFETLESQNEVPQGSFIVANGKVLLDIGAFIGRPVAALSESAVVDLVYQLIKVGAAAQTAINAGDGQPLPPGERLAAFAAPAIQPPRTSPDGQLYALATGSVTAVLPIQVGAAQAPKQ